MYHNGSSGGFGKHGKSGDVYYELDFFARFSHERLVPFVGHCMENENERFLIYKQMPHRDLANALYRKATQQNKGLQSLDWITRLKIATGAAEALYYLHHECEPPLVHSCGK
ncbi:hypothetical protein IEQ34_004506 [Dendrobium chrysotoxum]|uniref:Protein kinase domain-containing protein n=1 Tax=Dendrobium chrysotoxum TaxID=161865 RepID=A0AAV7HIK7_DENCH|nr:hypothetical protein IEQ34_004506 [Dendrobium chrysotoxum]